MSNAAAKLERVKDADLDVSALPPTRNTHKRSARIIPLSITLATIAIAVVLGWAMWNAYMVAPWTRDSTIRTYVVAMAPEVAGRVVELPVADNQFVHKGDLLLVIDPTDYKIALELAEAAVRQAHANMQNFEAQITAQQAQVTASHAQVERAEAALTFAEQQAARYHQLAQRQAGTVQMEQQTASTLGEDRAALKNAQAAVALAERQVAALEAQLASAQANIAQVSAQRSQARINLERTYIRSPVNGWVTNSFGADR